MPTHDDSLRRAIRERDAAAERGDTETADILDRAIDQLIKQLEEDDGPPTG